MTGGLTLVTGALGNIGATVADELLSRGARVRVAGTDRRPLRARHPGASAVALDFTEPSTFAPALAGVRAVFLMRPPAIARVGPTINRFLDAAVDAGVAHVVFSSVAGAQDSRIVPHHRIEVHLKATDMGWTMLRPGFFAQNLGGAYRTDIREDDRISVPAADGRVAFIDTRDLGAVAAAILSDPTPHAGRGDAADVDPALAELLGRSPRTISDYVTDHRDLWV